MTNLGTEEKGVQMPKARLIGALVVVVLLMLGVATIGGVFGESADGDPEQLAVAAARTSQPQSRPTEPAHQPDRPVATTRPRPHTEAPPEPPTTIAPPSTQTTLPPPTTAPPPTAPPTSVPPTTTHQPPPTTVPPRAIPNAGSFEVWLRGNTGTGPDIFWWNAPYLRQLSYGLNTGWTDGDRAGYRCLYAFLALDDQIVGRVTFMRVEGASTYASVKDENMKEGVRYYDGTPAPDGISIELGDCPYPDVAYLPYTGPDQRPTVVYSTTSGQTLEVRNYKPVVVGEGITFQQTGSNSSRVTVVAYDHGNPVIVVYYESMSPNVVMVSDL